MTGFRADCCATPKQCSQELPNKNIIALLTDKMLRQAFSTNVMSKKSVRIMDLKDNATLIGGELQIIHQAHKDGLA